MWRLKGSCDRNRKPVTPDRIVIGAAGEGVVAAGADKGLAD